MKIVWPPEFPEKVLEPLWVWQLHFETHCNSATLEIIQMSKSRDWLSKWWCFHSIMWQKYNFIKVYVKYKLLCSIFYFWCLPNKEIGIAQRKWKCHSEPQYFHLGSDLWLRKGKLKGGRRQLVTGFYSSLRDFCAVTFEFNFHSKRNWRWFQSFW